MTKRILAALLAVMLCAFALMPLTAFAEAGEDTAEKTLPKGLVINCVGDSITWGSGSSNEGTANAGGNIAANTYAGQLAALIGGEVQISGEKSDNQVFTSENATIYVNAKPGASLLPDFAPGSVSVGGYASVPAIEQSFAREDADVIILMLGTNDSKITATEGGKYKVGIWDKRGAEDNFKAEYRELLDIYFNMESKPFVYCLLPPPALPNDVSPNYRITDANMKEGVIPAILEVVAECKEEGLPINTIDIRSAFPDPDTDQAALVEVLNDGVHPNSKGYAIMAETIYAQLLADTHNLTYAAEGADEGAAIPKGMSFFGNQTVTVKDTRGLCTKGGVANVGWSTEPNGGGTVYQEGDEISFTADMTDLTLYPVWSGNGGGSTDSGDSAGSGMDTTTLVIIIVSAVVIVALFAAAFVVLNKNKKAADAPAEEKAEDNAEEKVEAEEKAETEEKTEE